MKIDLLNQEDYLRAAELMYRDTYDFLEGSEKNKINVPLLTRVPGQGFSQKGPKNHFIYFLKNGYFYQFEA